MNYLRIRAGDCATTRDVLVRCIEADARHALLEPAALPPDFFDLSSGAAGELVQGLLNYGIRMAVVAPGLAQHSESFQAFVKETNRGRQFRVFESSVNAEAWLGSADSSSETPVGVSQAMNRPPHVITTDRLVLRRPRPADAAARFEYATDPELTRYMDWRPPCNLDDVAARIESAASRWESGEEYSWAITVKPDDRAVGGVTCLVRDHAVELGFVLAREYWGHGYASEAAKAVLEWAASLETVFRVWAACDVENAASARVLEKIGMSREGVLRAWAIRPNLAPEVPRDAFIYSWVRLTQ